MQDQVIQTSSTMLRDWLMDLGYNEIIPEFEDATLILRWLRLNKKELRRKIYMDIHVRKVVRRKDTTRISIGNVPYGAHDVLILPCDLVVFACES